MERRLKEGLKYYYEAPVPQRKEEFIRRLGIQKINLSYLVILQARYISKWAWFGSILFCILTYVMSCTLDDKYVGVVFAILPFWVMLSVTESMRSYRYGMEELELSARFSLKSVVMARLLVLGVSNLIELAVLSTILGSSANFHVLYVMTPYFLTAGGGLYIVRNIRGHENTMYCFILAAIVCILELIIQWEYKEIFLQSYINVWAVLCMAGVLFTIRECYRNIRTTEELAWN